MTKEEETKNHEENKQLCPKCQKSLVPFNDDYAPNGEGGWIKTKPDQMVCNNPDCENFFF